MWYDLFSLVYDPALEALYAPYRQRSVDALGLASGDLVLDVPCGTGQSVPPLVEAIGASGRVVGVDASSGMLRRTWEPLEAVARDFSREDLGADSAKMGGALFLASGVKP